jgi:hypothetical protein
MYSVKVFSVKNIGIKNSGVFKQFYSDLKEIKDRMP